MSSNLSSTITVYVDELDAATVNRPFGHHPAFTIAGAYIALLLTSSVASFAGASPWLLIAINMMALTVPALIAIYCYCKPLTVLRANQKWQSEFLSSLRMELGFDAELVNSAEMMIALRSGTAAYAEIHVDGRYETYDVAMGKNETVLFSMSGIDRDWALMNAHLDH